MRMNVFHGFVTSRCGGSSSKGGSKYPSHQGSGGGSGDTSDDNQRGGVPGSSRQNQPQLLVAEKANSRNKGVSNSSSVKQTVNHCNRQSDAGEGTHGNSSGRIATRNAAYGGSGSDKGPGQWQNGGGIMDNLNRPHL
ncbi:hypothetical protein Agabi119p4_1131 [Agaricus bisporus var. burnettii]|uniref:Uncharacterized protein n=1 Tax=Agaricus bisporus var. burnettii TaxID=192524 RepID=A0A8H7FC79_AGABI|nr:hypothetical protein Agabi119p4_1131 [Agaricus bisporus var. burnettii]